MRLIFEFQGLRWPFSWRIDTSKAIAVHLSTAKRQFLLYFALQRGRPDLCNNKYRWKCSLVIMCDFELRLALADPGLSIENAISGLSSEATQSAKICCSVDSCSTVESICSKSSPTTVDCKYPQTHRKASRWCIIYKHSCCRAIDFFALIITFIAGRPLRLHPRPSILYIDGKRNRRLIQCLGTLPVCLSHRVTWATSSGTRIH